MNMPPVARAWLAHFGSLRTTLVCMGLLGAAALTGVASTQAQSWALVGAIALTAANLVAALFVHPALRRQFALLVFHLALLALVLLAALGRMTALEGRFELTQGVDFDGTLLDSRVGAWHRDGLARLAFRNEGFEIDYAPGRKRGATRNRIRWRDAQGRPQSSVIGDHRPLVLDGYRFYTSPNKGFAPLLSWHPREGTPVTGAVHLPSFPSNELRQSIEWPLPDGRTAWLQLQFDETLIDPAAPAAFRLPDEHRLVLRVGKDLRAELRPGQSVDLGSATLVHQGLRSWMGYRVAYDPTLPWLLAAALLAAVALGVHYVQRFFFDAAAARPAPRTALSGVATVRGRQ